ncbi:MAG: nucleotidyltransferase domain-containing protein [Ignavibacteriaceae bacterium]|nr:nucleotidyltransferase domain-containing protein [Ignavibacteriaceae bacterium]
MKSLTKNLNLPLLEIKARIKEALGEEVIKIILFGSYARGENHEESDVDILVLVNDDDLRKYRKERIKIITGFLKSHDILLSIRIVKNDNFMKYREVIPFYRNIVAEGIALYG